MKTTGFLACCIVTLDCICDAMGAQTLFSPSFAWLWWPVALGWAISAIDFLKSDL